MIPRFPYEEPFDEELTDDEKGIINDGVKHHEEGYFHDMNPWKEGTRQHKLWFQGWTDQDMIEISENREP